MSFIIEPHLSHIQKAMAGIYQGVDCEQKNYLGKRHPELLERAHAHYKTRDTTLADILYGRSHGIGPRRHNLGSAAK
jgi:hypothetical protein